MWKKKLHQGDILMDCISQIPSNFLFLKKMRFFDHNVLEIICEIIQ